MSDQMLNLVHLSNQANALRGLPARQLRRFSRGASSSAKYASAVGENGRRFAPHPLSPKNLDLYYYRQMPRAS